MREIEKIVKEKRKDISNYIVHFKDGSSVGVEAKSEKEAEKLAKEWVDLKDKTEVPS